MKRFLCVVILALPVAAQQKLDLSDAIAMALEKNADVVVERESLAIAQATVLHAQAAYDPALHGEGQLRHRLDPVNSVFAGAPPGELGPTYDDVLASASVNKLLPSGATVSVFSTVGRESTNSILALLTPAWNTLLGAELRQPLLQNRKIDPARKAIRIARIDRARADASLRRTATEITAAVERAWWTLVGARADVEIRRIHLESAEHHREETRIRIEAGTEPETDLATNTAEVERRRSELAQSRESLTRAENALRNLILRDPADPMWEKEIAPAPSPDPPAIDIDVAQSIDAALARRPELEELQRRLERTDVEIEAARNRVSPQVDFVAAYTGRGLAGSENPDAIPIFGQPIQTPDPIEGGLTRSLGTIAEGRFPDASLGVEVSFPFGNRAAKQDVAIANASKRQAQALLDQARQRVAFEVRNAAAAVTSAEERLQATRAAREAAEVQAQAEMDRYEAGTSNHFFVFARQNDLAAARLAEVIARTDYRKALAELSRARGSLLSERGISLQ